MAPTRTIARTALPGRKKQKFPLTYLACANVDGLEKIQLMIIGKYLRSRPFKRRTGQELGFDYHNNKNALMNTRLFLEWLKRFDQYIGKINGLKAALLVEK